MKKLNNKTSDYKVLSKLDKQIDLLENKDIIVFDLDGTLTKSKTNLDKEMSFLLCSLLKRKIVAVIGGGNYSQFKRQLLSHFKCPKKLFRHLYLLPTSGGKMYKYEKQKWRLVYQNNLSKQEKKQILEAFEKAFSDTGYVSAKKIYGKPIEDRGSQITFSALGQKAPLEKKEEWNKNNKDIRFHLKTALEKYLPNFEIRLGGLTSIDVTKNNIDKAYGIKRIEKLLSTSIAKMAYIGDALYEGGNDAAVFKTGIDTVQVNKIEGTKYLIRKLINAKNDSKS